MQYRWLAAAAVAASLVGCGDDTGDGGGSGASGNAGGAGNSGNVGGVGNTGNIGNTGGGTGNAGNTGGAGNSGNTGGVGNSGGDGGTPVGGAGGDGGTAVGGSGGDGGSGGSGNPTGTAWINEIHYDNAMADQDEGVEIAGTAGLDVTGWSLVHYNGSNGTIISTTPLTGVLADQQNGFGTIFFAITGLQNDNEGLALVDGLGAVLQFLSYEGVVAATAGPANGTTSTDIGVAEIASPVGQSMQLTGTGFAYADFTWATGVASSSNAVNPGQSFGAPPAFTCDPIVLDPSCTIGSDVTCECEGCLDDLTCDLAEDCVCADCTGESFCDGCDNNGQCDPYLENCACADCAGHPTCP